MVPFRESEGRSLKCCKDQGGKKRQQGTGILSLMSSSDRSTRSSHANMLHLLYVKQVHNVIRSSKSIMVCVISKGLSKTKTALPWYESVRYSM